MNTETGVETESFSTDADERDPRWSDGAGFFYASDRTGIFNIYYHRGWIGRSHGDRLRRRAFEPAPAGQNLARGMRGGRVRDPRDQGGGRGPGR
ncbi:MAG: hypothetical protein MZU95_00465 [Desulfomicrobium escambiense]|nr:hypothetical protein [Desulfomicrobium escambiense]